MANVSANRAFEASVDVVAGRAQLEIAAPVGNLPEELLPRIAEQPGISAATPIIEGFVSLPQFPGEYLDVLGIDIFTNAPFRTFEVTDFDAAQFNLQQWLRGPRVIAVSEDLARSHKWRAGDEIEAQVNGGTVRLTIGFLLRSDQGGANLDSHFAAIDIGWAQELFAHGGTFDSISLRLTKGSDPAKTALELQRILPADVTVGPPARRGEEVEKMLAGFEPNLEAMSLVSLLVGMFLIYNTVEASVIRRRPEIGILRSLGMSGREVQALFLGEAVVLGAVGIVLGIAGGYSSPALVGTVADTISSLVLLVSVREIVVPISTLAKALLLGFASVIAASWLPARAAAAMDPIETLHHGTRLERAVVLSPGWIWGGAIALVLSIALSFFALQTGPAWLGFGAAFLVLAGFSSIAPAITAWFSRMICELARRQVELRLAAQNLGRTLLRNSVTIASLAAAVAMTVGVAVMVFSFRQTVTEWINQTLVADLFIGPASNEIAGPTSFVPPAAIAYLRKNPKVTEVDTYRGVELPFRDRTIGVAVITGERRRNLRFLRGDNDEIIRQFYEEECVLVSESFARRFHVAEGQALELPSPDGVKRFRIAGIFYDYTRDQGTVFLSAKNFVRYWHDDRVNSIALYLKAGADPAEIGNDFRQHFSRSGEFSIYSNRLLRTRIFEIFDQTFAVTYVLRAIAVIVAIVGIFLNLTTRPSGPGDSASCARRGLRRRLSPLGKWDDRIISGVALFRPLPGPELNWVINRVLQYDSAAFPGRH